MDITLINPTIAPHAALERPPQIGLRGVSVRYGTQTALHPLNLDVTCGEILVLLGPSGSGKTTLLRAIAGFVRPSTGTITLAGSDVTDLPPHRRDLGMVVQSYALFPHLRVAANVGFGLRARRRPGREISAAVERCLALVGMTSYAARYPRELSGGQQQRVAIARALAIEPAVLLLDEPLSALDAPLRADMLEEIRRLHAQVQGLSIVYVTHDQTEAISLAHRILLMREGRIVAAGSPRTLHDTPPNRYTAAFFGDANLIAVSACEPRGDGAMAVWVNGCMVIARASSGPLVDPVLCVRPHELRLAAPHDVNALRALVAAVQWLGAVQRLVVRAGDVALRLDLPGGAAVPAIGDAVHVAFDPARAIVLGA
jgi:ABC-type spermidine/putrescine transport systems, ATPase components